MSLDVDITKHPSEATSFSKKLVEKYLTLSERAGVVLKFSHTYFWEQNYGESKRLTASIS